MRKSAVFLMMLMVVGITGAMAASPFMTRFSGVMNYTNELGRSISVPAIMFCSDNETATNAATVSLIVIQDDCMTTNAGDTVTNSYVFDVLTFIGSTNWVSAAVLNLPTSGVLRISNSTAYTNSVYIPRE